MYRAIIAVTSNLRIIGVINIIIALRIVDQLLPCLGIQGYDH